MKNDTIVAVSTPRGVGGIAVIRLSGPDVLAIVAKHLTQNTQHFTLQPCHATYCRFDDLDDVVAVYFPKGYTGDPTVEISCHGSLYLQQALLQTLVADGARIAEAGEFTRRAFFNGRLDLSQAEAVADLIDSVTPVQHRLAVSQLRGGYSQKLKQLRQQLLDLTSLLELELDFSQEDVEFADRGRLAALVATLQTETTALVASFKTGNALKRGIPVAIVGLPNAGKSTLLNALLNDDRAIVSSIPGTTRDTIEETIVIDDIAFRLIDTAGIRNTDNEIEQKGIERSRKAIEQARIVIELVDVSDNAPLTSNLSELRDKTHIIALNKTDIAQANSTLNTYHSSLSVAISALTGEGLDNLKQLMVQSVQQDACDDVMLTNARHYEALVRVKQALDAVLQGLNDGVPADLVAVDLRDALYHLGTITGEVTSEDILGNIFGRFCVGK